MEKDIERLEKIVKLYYNCAVIEEGFDMGEEIVFMKKDAQAIENLIKRYRGLEAKIKRYEKYLENKDKKFEEALEYEYQERETDYISKSKIQEKIEELSKIKGDFATYIATSERIKVLQELMEDK